ncbi:hypothetical protein A2814_01700 [Candidatus Nomurabacteria bacterium RIFCSPHIGHO2_01_FULL_38_19]|uniref:Uncharacterized protein n=1 Tax=Candidatus Nomurabacteria bacterium RIFCSPHIGHO2_01_FULL_38_19 TaxID=1801732 RepID=A0A1F6UUX2_9BACT|nr:MAG: hypothetical protein A2814_01700 [Candidatus Nomurabacteria bacterium RIFCSPHIGHO2_01_FULL_38_19]
MKENKFNRIKAAIATGMAGLVVGGVAGNEVGYNCGQKDAEAKHDTLERTRTQEAQNTRIEQLNFVLKDGKVVFCYEFTYEGKRYKGEQRLPDYITSVDEAKYAKDVEGGLFSQNILEEQERDLQRSGTFTVHISHPRNWLDKTEKIPNQSITFVFKEIKDGIVLLEITRSTFGYNLKSTWKGSTESFPLMPVKE